MTINIQEAALAGEISIPCVLLGGKSADIVIRLVKLSERGKFLALALDERKALEFAIKSPEDFDVDTLTDESYEGLIAVNTELNFTRALASQQAEMARADKIGTPIRETLIQLGTLSQKYARRSPSAEDTPESSS